MCLTCIHVVVLTQRLWTGISSQVCREIQGLEETVGIDHWVTIVLLKESRSGVEC